MKVIEKILDILCLIAKWISAICLFLMLVVSLVEIVRRYIFGLSFIWTDEFIRYSIVIVASIGGASCYRMIGGLVSFDLVQTHLFGKARLALELVINTVVLGFVGFILKNAIKTVGTPSIVKQISIGLGISMKYPYMAIVLGMGLLVLLALEKYYDIVKRYKAGEYEKEFAPKAVEGGEN